MKKNNCTNLYVCIILVIVSLYIFSQFAMRDFSIRDFGIREMMGNSDDDGEYGNHSVVNMEAINRKCQTEYLSAVRGVLTGPTIDPKDGYISDKDVLKMVNAVNNNCRWNSITPVELQYDKFKKVLADNSDKNQINHLLISIS